MNFKNLEKCDILIMRKKIYLSKKFKCLVFFEVDWTSLLPLALKFDKNFTQNHFFFKKNHIFAFLTKKTWIERQFFFSERPLNVSPLNCAYIGKNSF